ncbi:hypothetical protein Y88_3618 [Novosphingobium nitrogenifigens DSM 19370]|uniref:SPOR domain-containing protein n=1 Tax=Novosphingobium nitrogenifigens DSM 19370 TaxID=983920 RepID=F1ZDF0_9SPHN|nr:SPOR domain-containing protein [Novosphingobium nitrogenifigens]EGD57309.1 hypothetical protein Y88_3618 [Novosphingobium nitrogenifigens DSM 19370]
MNGDEHTAGGFRTGGDTFGSKQASGNWQNDLPGDRPHDADATPGLDLGGEDRLPWLESADDLDDAPAAAGHSRLILAGLVALMVLGGAVYGIFWLTHRPHEVAAADGSLIEASKEPYKVPPSNPGGKTFQGTGDASFKVSQGEHPSASLAGSAGTTPPPAPASSPAADAGKGTPAPKPSETPKLAEAAKAAATGGIGVQVGAYSNTATAEAGWTRLVGAHDILKGLNHRVVEGKADIGTVYRLQVVAGDIASANSLCGRLQADGVKCQVKR